MINMNMMSMMNSPQWALFQQWLLQQQASGFIPSFLTDQQIYNYFQMYLMNNNIVFQNPGPIQNQGMPQTYPQPNPQTGENKIKELIPRNNYTNFYEMGNGQNIINITLNASTGNKTVINASANTTIEHLLKMYTTKLGLSPDVIGKQIMFLYNGSQLAPDSQTEIGSIFRNTAVITVYDLGGIIGA